MPTLTFCNPQPLQYCGKNTWPYYQNAFECIASKDNVSEFIESITFKNHFKGNVLKFLFNFLTVYNILAPVKVCFFRFFFLIRQYYTN